jgi:hypothetical protein
MYKAPGMYDPTAPTQTPSEILQDIVAAKATSEEVRCAVRQIILNEDDLRRKAEWQYLLSQTKDRTVQMKHKVVLPARRRSQSRGT